MAKGTSTTRRGKKIVTNGNFVNIPKGAVIVSKKTMAKFQKSLAALNAFSQGLASGT